MGKYRKKPVVVNAIQWTGENRREMFDFLTNYEKTDKSIESITKDFFISRYSQELVIKTFENAHVANVGDYIIRGAHGEFYPCKPDIFRETYEEVME